MPTHLERPAHAEIDASRMIVSRSPEMQRIWELLRRVAPTDASVLVSGPTGTGKELIARLVHKLSPRRDREFLAVDCMAVAPTLLESELFGHERGAFTGADRERMGVFELAHGTTLFLDEITNLPLEAQAKLLRVLQEREFRRLGGRRLIRTDFRLVTASNVDLAGAVRAGSFRGDLYHRLNVVAVELPPLKARREDIPLLVTYFVNKKRARLQRQEVCRVSRRALDLLAEYEWPGNVRELENAVETALLQCSGDTIDVEHFLFPGAGTPRPAAPEAMDLPYREARRHALASFERAYLVAQLTRYRGSIKHTARHAGVTPKHVRELLRRHGISRRDFRGPRPPVPSGRSWERDAG